MFKNVNLSTATPEEVRCYIVCLQEYSAFITFAYDARNSYGVNYRDLREYGEMEGVAAKASHYYPEPRMEAIVTYLRRLKRALVAAVNRRHNIHLAVSNPPDYDPDGLNG